MGGGLSMLILPKNEGGGDDAAPALDVLDSQALAAFLTKHDAQSDGSDRSFEARLYLYLTADGGNGMPGITPAQRFAALISSTKQTRIDALFGLATSGADGHGSSVRDFIESVCKCGIGRFWNGSMDTRLDSWVVDWILTLPQDALVRAYGAESEQPPFGSNADDDALQQCMTRWLKDTKSPGAVGAQAWHAWWRGCAALQELLCLALAAALYPCTSRVSANSILPGVAEVDIRCPRLPPDLSVAAWLTGAAQGHPATLLTPSIAWALYRELPYESRKEWSCVYSSKRDGRSWGAFCGAVERRGSLLLLVREKAPMALDGGSGPADVSESRLLGAYIDGELERRPKWQGTPQNLLFCAASARGNASSQSPGSLAVYRASGLNDHYQYFNYATKSLPNGLGVGGQLGHFGLWLDSNFTTGCSNPAATFASQRLSAEDEFAIDTVEAWLVQPSRNPDSDDDGRPSKSVVEANPDAAALLEMANRTMYSRALPTSKTDDVDSR